MRARFIFATFFLPFVMGIAALSALVSSHAIAATKSAVICPSAFAELVTAEPISINEAKRFAQSAWETTTRYLRRNGISETEANHPQILKVFDRALSHELTPLGSARGLRNESGMRVVDAPQLETLRDQGVPDFVIRHLTVDHHSSFGAGLPLNVNSTTQLLDLLDPKNVKYVDPAEFNRAFKKFASDNVGDAFGLARAVVRNANAVRGDPALRARLREIAVAEDFGIFGPGLDLKASDTVPALLRMNDRMLTSIGPDRTFMDRVNLGFGETTAKTIDQAGRDYDRVLFPKSRADKTFAKKLAKEFRQSIDDGIAQAEKLKIPLHTKTGANAPIFFADTTSLGNASSPFFQSRLIIPQFVRSQEQAGAAKIERNFNIMGDANAATRTVICANFPDRGTSMMLTGSGQSKSFVEAFVEAERRAIEARLPTLRLRGDGALREAEGRLAEIRAGRWLPQNLPNGNLLFGSTYMNAAEFKSLVEDNLELLGYR